MAITKLDRLARMSCELGQLLTKSDVEIVAVEHHPDRQIRMKSEAARIQKQTELLKDRTREGIKRAKERGVVFGNPINLPEAQKKGAEATRIAAQARLQELAPIIEQIQAEGAVSGGEIAKRLNQLGVKTARGGDWTNTNVRRVLRDMKRDKSNSKKVDAEYRKDPRFGIWG